MSIRIAVIGAGLMGADHAKIVAEDLPSARLQVICDMDANRAKTIADTAKTDKIGDGKIFTLDVEGALRVRTGEVNEDAL